MSISVNVFYAYLAQQLDAGGSETTIYLDRVTTRTGETITTSDFATVGRGVITVNPDGNGETSFPEFVAFTGVSGLTLTGATRGLSAKGNTPVAANKRFHPVGTPVVISFGVHNLQDIFDYIDNEVGALTVGSNMVVTGLAGESVSAGQIVYLKDDGKWWLADADVIATIDGVMLGIAQGTGVADGAITNGVLRKGLDANQSGLTQGDDYFIGNTAGAISATAGTNTRKIGIGRSSTQLYFDPEYAQLPSSGEKAAMAGGGAFGTPSSTNKFLTNEYINCGDGSDGDVTISSPTTLTRNMYYNNLTVNSILTTNGYQIFVKETISGTGTVDFGTANNGGNASGSTVGAGGAESGAFLKNTAGGSGALGQSSASAGGSATVGAISECVGSNGVAGGAGGAGQDGAGGTSTAGTASIIRKFGILRSDTLSVTTASTTNLLLIKAQGAAVGGGGGGGDGTFAGSVISVGSGGGGGASGGIVFIACRTFAGTFTIKATGGNGGNGSAPVVTASAVLGGGGGGAGGNGGIAIVVYGSKTWTGSYNLAGGTGGTGATGSNAGGTGGNGTTGATGTIYEKQINSLI